MRASAYIHTTFALSQRRLGVDAPWRNGKLSTYQSSVRKTPPVRNPPPPLPYRPPGSTEVLSSFFRCTLLSTRLLRINQNVVANINDICLKHPYALSFLLTRDLPWASDSSKRKTITTSFNKFSMIPLRSNSGYRRCIMVAMTSQMSRDWRTPATSGS